MRRTLLLIAALALSAAAASADVALPPLLSEGMVLQQGTPVRIWGTASPGESVSVTLAGKKARTAADRAGDWQVRLGPLRAGGPHTLSVQGNNRLTVRDVLVGEVWVCSGQSNMEWSLAAQVVGAEAEYPQADNALRMFTVQKATSAAPETAVSGRWESAGPSTTPRFSAVGYFFAKALRRSRHVPVGMIHTSWGGTRIEAWMSQPALERLGAPTPPPLSRENRRQRLLHERLLARWREAGSPAGPFADPGRSDASRGWERPEFDDSGWREALVPAEWDDSGAAELRAVDGGVWLRRRFDLAAGDAGKPATLSLGAIDDYDTAFVNGVEVGSTGPETPNAWQHPRRYAVPAGLLRAGANVVAVRVWDSNGGGGIVGPADRVRLVVDGGATVALEGAWRYAPDRIRPAHPGTLGDPNAASALYNAMLHPVAPYTLQGALWYQGESNAGNPRAYRTLLPAMIQDWRRAFENPGLVFLIAQLAPFQADGPEKTSYAEIREAQDRAATALPRVASAVLTDVGDLGDIHPRDKRPVGERLALLARRIAYRERIVARGPVFRRLQVRGNEAIVTFGEVGGGLAVRGGTWNARPVPSDRLVGFTVAGSDGRFVPAEARLEGRDRVIVSSPQVPRPVAVRFGFVNFPLVNLWNADGLPAYPFRTDAPK